MSRVYQALNRAEREGVRTNGELPRVEVDLIPPVIPPIGPPTGPSGELPDVGVGLLPPVPPTGLNGELPGVEVGLVPPVIPDDAPETVPGIPAQARPIEEIGEIEHVVFVPRSDSHVVVHDPRRRAAAESFRLLRYRLEKLRERQPISSVLIASAIPKEGKTLVSINLASALALTSTRVLLVDADLRRPGIPSALGMRALPGLAEVLQEKMSLRAAYRRVDPLGFYLLPAGRIPVNPVELLQSTAMRALMSDLTSSFDWVVVDSPPLLPFADGHCLASLCNAVLMVAREGITPKEALQEALGSLKAAHVIGTILNGAQTPNDDEYYSGYGRKNGAKNTPPPAAARPQQVM